MSDHHHAVLDVVGLRVPSGRWAAGTQGTVVEADDQSALVEISDTRGRATDFVSVPHDELAPLARRASPAAS